MAQINRRVPESIDTTLILTIVVAVVVLLVGCGLLAEPEPDLRSTILAYCETHEEIRLSEVTDFDWDIAYVDREPYSDGQTLREKYDISGAFEPLETDFSSRIAFCENGILVYDLKLNNWYLELDRSIDSITPDSVLSVAWVSPSLSAQEQIPVSTPRDRRKLFLSPK